MSTADRGDPYPPPVYSEAVDNTAAPPASLVWWAGSVTAAGILLGALWWFAAPGGAFHGDGKLPETWLPRDLTLAVLELAAGVVLGWLLVRRRRLPGAWQRVCAAVGGSLAGSVLAVVAGQWLGMLIGPSEPGDQFLLRALGVALIWPAATALTVFVVSLLSLLLRGNRN